MMHRHEEDITALVESTTTLIQNYRYIYSSMSDQFWRYSTLKMLETLGEELNQHATLPASEKIGYLTDLFCRVFSDLKEYEHEKYLLNDLKTIWNQFSLHLQEEEPSEEPNPAWEHLCCHLRSRLQDDTGNALVQEITLALGFIYEDESHKVIVPDIGLGGLIKKARKLNTQPENFFVGKPTNASIKRLLQNICKPKSTWPFEFSLEVMEYRQSLSVWRMETVVNLCQNFLRAFAKEREVNEISFDDMRIRINKFICNLLKCVIQPIHEMLGVPVDLDLKEARERIKSVELKILTQQNEINAVLKDDRQKKVQQLLDILNLPDTDKITVENEAVLQAITACYYYLNDHPVHRKDTHGLNATRCFVQSLLRSSALPRECIQHEALRYIDGEGKYGTWYGGASGARDNSRFRYLIKSGLLDFHQLNASLRSKAAFFQPESFEANDALLDGYSSKNIQ